MPFVRKSGIEGLVFEPEECPPGAKRHDCPDCFYCQQCSEVRCRACRSGAGRKGGEEERSSCSRKGNRSTKAGGYTLIELVLVVAVVVTLAVSAFSRFFDFSSDAKTAAESGEVAAIQSGIRLYASESQVMARTPIFISSLDSAVSGPSSSSNQLFSGVLVLGMTDGRWAKASTTRYTSPSGKSYKYNSDDGTFLESSASFSIITTSDGVTVSSSYGRLTGSYAGSATEIMIPKTLNGYDVQYIWQDVFNGKGLTAVAFEEDIDVERIHARAFMNNSLTEIDFPDGLKRIDLLSFDSNNLTEVVLPSSLEVIEMRAFNNNDITTITIGAGVTMGENAFGDNTFRDAYSFGGAGTYALVGGVWTKTASP